MFFRSFSNVWSKHKSHRTQLQTAKFCKIFFLLFILLLQPMEISHNSIFSLSHHFSQWTTLKEWQKDGKKKWSQKVMERQIKHFCPKTLNVNKNERTEKKDKIWKSEQRPALALHLLPLLSLSLSFTHTHTHLHTHTYTHTHSLSFFLTCLHLHTHTLSLPHLSPLTHTHSLSHAHTHSHALLESTR